MTTQLDIKGNGAEKCDPVSPNNGINKVYVIGKYDINPWQRMIMITPKELKGQKLPQKFLNFIYKISPQVHDQLILDNAMKNLGEIVEEPEPIITKTAEKTLKPVEPAKPIKAEKNLDSIVGNYHNSDVNPELNTFYNKNGATIAEQDDFLAEQDDLMAHYTIAGANIFNDFGNNLSSKVKNFYNGIRNIKAGTIKKVVLEFATLTLVAALTTGCGGVIPEPPTPPPGPVQKIEIPAGFDKDYFEEICFTWEYGSSKIHPTYRWVDDPKLFLINPSEEQRKIAENKMSELAEFTNYVVIPKIVDNINSANVTVEWCDLDEIPYGNVAYCTFSHKNGVIYDGEILVYKNLDSILTKHAFLEEAGAVLGVTNDSYKYDDSIFYQGPCQSTEFTIQDLAVGDVLYQLNPGTTLSEFEEIFENSTKTYSFFDKF